MEAKIVKADPSAAPNNAAKRVIIPSLRTIMRLPVDYLRRFLGKNKLGGLSRSTS